MRTDYGTILPSAVACLEDDFEACIAHLILTRRASTRECTSAGRDLRGQARLAGADEAGWL